MLIRKATPIQASVPPLAIVAALGASAVTGVLFGMLPAHARRRSIRSRRCATSRAAVIPSSVATRDLRESPASTADPVASLGIDYPGSMPLFEAVRLALQQIRVQKLKSFFTLLGVMIGVMFLIAVVSIVEGMSKYMEEDFAGRLLGANTFTLRRFPWFGNNTTRGRVARVAAPPARLSQRRRASVTSLLPTGTR